MVAMREVSMLTGMKAFRLIVLFAMVFMASAPIAEATQFSGAVFATTENGDRVDSNIYEYKPDVYLNGGLYDASVSFSTRGGSRMAITTSK